VWADGGTPPTKKHLTELDAHREAERLAQLNPGRSFYVLNAITRTVRQSVVTVTLEPRR
jgi:hypothetical protein